MANVMTDVARLPRRPMQGNLNSVGGGRKVHFEKTNSANLHKL